MIQINPNSIIAQNGISPLTKLSPEINSIISEIKILMCNKFNIDRIVSLIIIEDRIIINSKNKQDTILLLDLDGDIQESIALLLLELNWYSSELTFHIFDKSIIIMDDEKV